MHDHKIYAFSGTFTKYWTMEVHARMETKLTVMVRMMEITLSSYTWLTAGPDSSGPTGQRQRCIPRTALGEDGSSEGPHVRGQAHTSRSVLRVPLAAWSPRWCTEAGVRLGPDPSSSRVTCVWPPWPAQALAWGCHKASPVFTFTAEGPSDVNALIVKLNWIRAIYFSNKSLSSWGQIKVGRNGKSICYFPFNWLFWVKCI